MPKRVKRTRNHFTYTEAQFWQMIRQTLRRRSYKWKPASEIKKLSRRPFEGKGRQKWEYQCASCNNWFPDKEVQVDHIIPAGSLKCAEDLPEFVNKLFCEVDGLQVLCKKCHQEKTNKERGL
jgi:5-methylcytosine-specific restriction endonuclease McrA